MIEATGVRSVSRNAPVNAGSAHSQREVGKMMRRMHPFAAAVLGALVVLVAVVAAPGLGIGETTTSHGLTPSDVFTSTEPDTCNPDVDTKIGPEPASLLPTSVHIAAPSHVVAYFTATSSGPGKETELVQTLQLSGEGFHESSAEWISQGGSQGFTIHATDTVMWTFANVPAGDYVAEATARVAAFTGAVQSGDGANLQSCALTVVVTPVA